VEQRTGISLTVLEDLAARMKVAARRAARYGLTMNPAATSTPAPPGPATDLNEFTHFVAKPAATAT
jgi:hypothetical protein